MKNAVLVVDDEPQVIRAIARALLDEDIEVSGATCAEQAQALLAGGAFKAVISDQQMPGMEGSEFLAWVSLRHPEVVRIMLTGHATLSGIMEAVNRGEIYRFFTKPWSDLELRFALRAAMEKFDLETRVRRLMTVARCQTYRLRQLEAQHPGITRLRRQDGAHDLTMPAAEEIDDLLRELGVER
ncbi:Response regulator receiver domain-containing protein [Geoalkalibacter ferrihydriticus]|uniref:Response regulatory domain-containing protein n=2 Tax=Geoalkalibacter ferrihydriticus TaxID=392333 RepID=A0A0C2HGZ4_9BACT|nr:response regulator [Geoalkalibacter ferrihydriticus]KIH76236.1 hypothetical protein GFER_11455 [Geoalkalibacter ferrihydriticus DSM 17813]SDL25385.1 Response regulator receiver domain-containing protein [Geoalkalibacter ferrihydriticus]